MTPRLFIITALAMLAFAGNSVLCRAALEYTQIDPASFTVIRLVSGVVALLVIVALRRGFSCRQAITAGTWGSAAALFVYAAGFSFAYISMTAATGALLLFGTVQSSMIGYGLWRGERFTRQQWFGLAVALGGLLVLLLPGVSAPALLPALMMVAAGMAWAVYSLRGKREGAALLATTGNFVRTLPLAALLAWLFWSQQQLDSLGILYAVLSGAIASGVGYAIWYAALPHLPATKAATVQLSVPVIVAVIGLLWLDEALALTTILASVAILGGVYLVISHKFKGAGT